MAYPTNVYSLRPQPLALKHTQSIDRVLEIHDGLLEFSRVIVESQDNTVGLTKLVVDFLLENFENILSQQRPDFKRFNIYKIVQNLAYQSMGNKPEISFMESAKIIKVVAEKFLVEQGSLCGIIIHQHDFTISLRDRTFAPHLYSYILDEMKCVEFAKFQLNISEASFDKDFLANNFDPVDSPLKGDFVVYEKLQSPVFDDLHVGIYEGNGLIVSKWGKCSHIFIHPLESIVSSYGDCVRFFRKKHRFECQVTSLNNLKELVLGNVPHSIIYTAKGLQECFVRIFKEASKKNLEVVFERSMFGQGSLSVYRKVAIKKLRGFDASGLSRREYLEQMKFLVNQTANDQPVYIPR